MKYLFFLALISSTYFLTLSCSDTTKSKEVSGKNTFLTYCITCHGANGKLGLNGAKDLTKSVLDIDQRTSIITNGRGGMASYKNVLSAQEIKEVAKYTTALK